MIFSAKILRITIDTIENKYMKNCKPEHLEGWIQKRKQIFAELIEAQLANFNHG